LLSDRFCDFHGEGGIAAVFIQYYAGAYSRGQILYYLQIKYLFKKTLAFKDKYCYLRSKIKYASSFISSFISALMF